MKRISREKAALGVFAFLAVAGLCVLIAYIVTVSHSLNVAASSIDDATGSLDGYTVLLSKGTVVDRNETVIDAGGLEGKISARTLNRSSSQDTPDNEVSASDAAPDGDDAQQTGVGVFALAQSYIDKQARVIEIDVENPTIYRDRYLVRAGSFTYGFLYLDEVTAQPTYFKKRLADYESLDVDFVVAVVSDLSLLDDYSGAAIVLSLQDEGLSSKGAFVDGIFYDDVAPVGQVGTILVSPSRTVTAKDATSL